MHIYLDESYNLQKQKGKMFISINGFAVLDANQLRKRWQRLRKPYTNYKRRIHATDPYFEELRAKSLLLLKDSDATILSIFQIVQEIPYTLFDDSGLKFDTVYAELLKILFKKLSFKKHTRIIIIIDSRKHTGGIPGRNRFQQNIENFLRTNYSDIFCSFLPTPSYLDTLVELANFVSNSFYKAYQKDENTIFKPLRRKLIQIKNPL
ncbi:MAG: hypothetical protein UT91_C0005G0033 [Parcubacteria group bacterium GW2011_GWA2_40_23]|nr:MAG: hypothetical protein UT91_C0005G0033 [Parcubacteria group bacterium GW2011_GWA2_40_23]